MWCLVVGFGSWESHCLAWWRRSSSAAIMVFGLKERSTYQDATFKAIYQKIKKLKILRY